MRVRVKICGVSNLGDALLAAQLGADAIGLNFYQSSPRCIDLETAADIRVTLPPFVEPIALFVNAPMKQIKETAHGLEIRTVQVHREAHEAFPTNANLTWIPAFSVKDELDLQLITSFFEMWHLTDESPWDDEDTASLSPEQCAMPAAILVDAHVPGQYGGTGQTAPWHLLADFKPGVPLILAGGLTPENVAEAIRIVKPYAVDVASGVESAPGKKDPDKLRRFMDAVRQAGAALD